MKIAHVTDKDLLSSIRNFYHECSCQNFRLTKPAPGQEIDVWQLFLEVSLECQGRCPYCIRDASHWRGKYDYYDALTKIFDLLRPKFIPIEGGEVLIQKKTLEWIEETKKTHPDSRFQIITNGNVSLDMVEKVERLFDSAIITLSSFEPETYEIITGMKLERAVKFVEALAGNRKIKTIPKYTLMPQNITTTHLFLEWAINLNPEFIYIHHLAGFKYYINMDTEDRLWEEIFERSKEKVLKTLLKYRDKLIAGKIKIQISTPCLEALGLHTNLEGFLKKNGLQKNITAFPF